jgi:hypothetical protein
LGVVKTGEVVNAILPDPETFCPRAVATPVPKEVIPVPPEATGSADPSVSEVRCVTASTTLVPLLNTHMVLPAGTAMPVPVVFLTVTVSARPLLIR